MSLKYKTIIPLTKIDDISKNKALKIFNAYRKTGTILSNNWDSDIWYTTDEYVNVGINFTVNQKVILGIKKDEFIDCLKTYTCFLFGDIALLTIQTCVNNIKNICTTSDLSKIAIDKESRIEEFLSFLPDECANEVDTLLDYLDNLEEKELLKGRRELASFESYYLFRDLINRYWLEANNEEEKLFYFPIYLWWQVTTIVPERPREFILTPRDCLKEENGKYLMKLRKDKLKGNDKTVAYKINDDFDIFEFQITKKVAEDINWYLNKTKDIEDSRLDTLFVMNTHYKSFGRKPGIKNRYLTYANFNTILKSFYINIIQDLYGYEIVTDRTRKYLNSNQIQFIRLGDTRHLSLINIISEGGSPVVAMQLARHSNINITFAYAANVSKMVECKAYRYLNGISGYAISEPIKTAMPREYTLVGETPCGYENIKKSDFSMCINAVGKDGKIGDCDSCPLSKIIKRNRNPKDDVQKNVKFLVSTINQVRKNKGCVEDILCALSSLATSNYSYQQYLIEKEKQNG